MKNNQQPKLQMQQISDVGPELLKKATALLFPEPSAIEDWEELYKGLEITDFKNPDQVKTVKDAHRHMVKERNLVKKRLAAIISDIEIVKKNIKFNADLIFGRLLNIEDPLKILVDQIKEETKSDRAKRKSAADKKLAERIATLFEVGFMYDGANYIIGLIILDPDQIKKATEEEFAAMLENGANEKERLEKYKNKLLALEELDQGHDVQEEIEKVSEHLQENPVQESPFEPNSEVIGYQVLKDKEIKEPISDNLEDYKPEGFKLGFDACRIAIIEKLKNPEKVKRSDLILWIEGLDY